MEKVASAKGNLAIDDAGHLGKVVVNTHINDAEMETVLTAKHVDTSPTLGEVDHLLPRHLTRRDAHAFTLNAVITTEKEVTRMSERGSKGLLSQTYLHSKGFQPT